MFGKFFTYLFKLCPLFQISSNAVILSFSPKRYLKNASNPLENRWTRFNRWEGTHIISTMVRFDVYLSPMFYIIHKRNPNELQCFSCLIASGMEVPGFLKLIDIVVCIVCWSLKENFVKEMHVPKDWVMILIAQFARPKSRWSANRR